MSAKPHIPMSREQVRKNMSAIRAKGNRTEEALRKALYKLGYRYRKYFTSLPGKPDIVFTRAKVAIFVDGDFWHARSIRERGWEEFHQVMRSENSEYWTNKFQRRIEIDKAVNAELSAIGWCVLRFWERDIRSDLTAAVSIIKYHLESRTNTNR